MRALIDDLSRDHVVILDAPPLLPVTDAGLLAAMCDGAILVLATARTRKEELEMCGKILGQVGGRLLGVVMNLAPKRGVSNVYYGYGYGYGTGYATYEKAYQAYVGAARLGAVVRLVGLVGWQRAALTVGLRRGYPVGRQPALG